MKRLAQLVLSLTFGGLLLCAVLWHVDLRRTMVFVDRLVPAENAVGSGRPARDCTLLYNSVEDNQIQ